MELLQVWCTKENSIEKEFNFLILLQFAFPTIIMMMVSGLYTIVDSILTADRGSECTIGNKY